MPDELSTTHEEPLHEQDVHICRSRHFSQRINGCTGAACGRVVCRHVRGIAVDLIELVAMAATPIAFRSERVGRTRTPDRCEFPGVVIEFVAVADRSRWSDRDRPWSDICPNASQRNFVCGLP